MMSLPGGGGSTRGGRLAVLGESPRVDAYALVGALVVPVADPAAVRRAWEALPDDVSVVVLTPAAAEAVGSAPGPAQRLQVVMPA